MSGQKNPLTDSEIHALLEENWDAISRRAADRAARQFIWDRRLRRINTVLTAAVVLMSFQVGWSLVVLARLQGTAAQTSEIVETVLSLG